MDGLINLDKPTGITSAKALYKVRSITRQRKSGHAGTLDPGATGVLILCLGKATKLVESIMNQPKVYRAAARLDVTSESFDSDRPLLPVPVSEVPSIEAVRRACDSFEGEIQQVPPRISAIKVGGVPAYKRAARDQPMDLKPRPVHIHWLWVHNYDWPTIEFEMCCSRGTYVRSLIRDLGEKLGTGGCLTSLARTRVGPFTQTDAWTIESVQAAAAPSEYLIELDRSRSLLEQAAITIPERPFESSPALDGVAPEALTRSNQPA